MNQVQLTLPSIESARAVIEALDAYTRVSIGQLHIVAEMVSMGKIAKASPEGQTERSFANTDELGRVRDLMDSAKAILEYPANGSHGVGHRHNSQECHYAWEACKVLQKAIAEHDNPDPKYRGVHYDGLIVRYTDGPEPAAVVVNDAPPGCKVQVTLPSVESARAMKEALQTYALLNFGQIHVLTNMVAAGKIPTASEDGRSKRRIATERAVEGFRSLMEAVKDTLGFSDHGIRAAGHNHNVKASHHAWEAYLVLQKTIAEYDNPNPNYRSLNPAYDGLILRYTDGPEPTAVVTKDEPSEVLQPAEGHRP